MNLYWESVRFTKNFIVLNVLITPWWLIVFSLAFLFCNTSVVWILNPVKFFQLFFFFYWVSVGSFEFLCISYKVFCNELNKQCNEREVKTIKRIADHSSRQEQYLTCESSGFLSLVHSVVNYLLLLIQKFKKDVCSMWEIKFCLCCQNMYNSNLKILNIQNDLLDFTV